MRKHSYGRNWAIGKHCKQCDDEAKSRANGFRQDDLIVYEKMAINSMLKHFKRDPDDYEIVYTLKDKETCFAFNRSIDDELIWQFQAALTRVVATSKYSELKKKFFSEN